MIVSIVRKIAGATVFLLAGLVGYLCFWPVPAEPGLPSDSEPGSMDDRAAEVVKRLA